jgi:ABC-type nickel/cobalt efflux system permease component RcnA
MEVAAAARTDLDKRFRAAVIIVFSQIAAAVALIVSTFLFVKNTDNSTPFETLMPLWGGVLFIALGAFLLRRRLYNWEKLKDVAVLKGESGLLQTLQKNANSTRRDGRINYNYRHRNCLFEQY